MNDWNKSNHICCSVIFLGEAGRFLRCLLNKVSRCSSPPTRKPILSDLNLQGFPHKGVYSAHDTSIAQRWVEIYFCLTQQPQKKPSSSPLQVLRDSHSWSLPPSSAWEDPGKQANIASTREIFRTHDWAPALSDHLGNDGARGGFRRPFKITGKSSSLLLAESKNDSFWRK